MDQQQQPRRVLGGSKLGQERTQAEMFRRLPFHLMSPDRQLREVRRLLRGEPSPKGIEVSPEAWERCQRGAWRRWTARQIKKKPPRSDYENLGLRG